MVRWRVRLRFSKQGDLRWIGHRDLARCFERWFRRAGLPLRMSEGFHPKPRISFPLALAVGIAGVDEVLELELTELLSAGEIASRLAPGAPAGLAINTVEALPPQGKKAQVHSVEYQIPVPPQRETGLADRIQRIRQSDSWPVAKPNRPRPVDLCAALVEMSYGEHVLRFRLQASHESSAGPREVLVALEMADLEQHGALLTRTAVELVPCA